MNSASYSSPFESDEMPSHGLKRAWSHPSTPYILSIFFIALDWLSGVYIQFPVTFVIPVALAAWFGTPRSACVLAIGQPVINFVINELVHEAPIGLPMPYYALNCMIRVLVLLVLAYFIHRNSRQNKELKRRVGLLRAEIPTCFKCKKVKDEKSHWMPIDLYVRRHAGANFTNALCPACRDEETK